MVPKWLTHPGFWKSALFIILVLAAAVPAASQWKTVRCDSDFGDGATCCQWCFFWGCDDCWVLVDDPAGAAINEDS